MSDAIASPLIFALLLDGAGGARALTLDEVRSWRAEDGVRWVHLDHRHPEAAAYLPELAAIGEFEARGLLDRETRPRIAIAEDHMLVTLRGVNLNPGANPDDMVSLRCWASASELISLRHRKVMAVQDIRDQLAEGRGPKTASDLLLAITARLTDRMGPQITEIEERVDEVEQRIIEDELSDVRRDTSELRRTAINLRRYIAPQRDVLSNMLSDRPPWFDDRDLRHLREVRERVTRYVEDLDAARERASVTQEELTQRLSERMNRTMYVLSIVAAVFLPLSLLTGLLGINVGGIPGSETSAAFIMVSAGLILLALVEVLIFRRMRWF